MSDANPPSSPVVTRFAPSPTGELHIGGARTALYAWAYARRHGGQFLLRFEDTDLARSSEASADRILEDLQWLGLDWDNADIPRQSKRHAAGRYDEVIQQLLDQGDAYEDGDAVRFKMGTHRGDVTFDDAVYGTIHTPAADLEDFIIRKGDAGGKMPTFHLAVVVDDHDFGVTHVIRGQEHLSNTAKHAALCDALGWDRPTWAHTPSIMNPGGSKMSKRDKAKVSRREALLYGDKERIEKSEFSRRVAWQTLSGFGSLVSNWWNAPATVTISEKRLDEWGFQADFVENDRELLSEALPRFYMAFLNADLDNTKIAADFARFCGFPLPEVDVADFRRSGYLPTQLLNYVALLGWNPGNDLEHFDLKYLAEHFSLDRINKANSTFDRAKLASFNQDAILQMSLDEFEPVLRSHFVQFHSDKLEQLGDNFRLFSDAYWERSKTLDDPATLGAFVFAAPSEYNAKAVKKNLTKNENQGLQTLKHLHASLATVSPWDAPTIRASLEQAVADLEGPHMGHVAQPLRVALTGTAVSPEIDATLALLGRDETLNRIARCLEEFVA
ncbi:MAG: glutamate--tRNA ligase family protein [Planctomycetota bacterium]